MTVFPSHAQGVAFVRGAFCIIPVLHLTLGGAAAEGGKGQYYPFPTFVCLYESMVICHAAVPQVAAYVVFALALIFGFNLYTRRFRNPYKLVYIFGKKGSGKSTLMVKEMLRHSKRGWIIYTDMEDCLVPGARIIKALDLATFAPPPHSCLFLEEVGITFDNRKYKSFDDGLRDFMKFMRKYKCKCYMNSQSYDVDKKVRDVVDSMILQTSIADCISVSRPILKSVTLTEPSAEAESRIAEKLKFAGIWHWKLMWMPKYHRYFDSFAAPAREPIPYAEVKKELAELRRKKPPYKLRKSYRDK